MKRVGGATEHAVAQRTVGQPSTALLTVKPEPTGAPRRGHAMKVKTGIRAGHLVEPGHIEFPDI
jgi:hypothetical protein